MSLVDYASSSDDDFDHELHKEEEDQQRQQDQEGKQIDDFQQQQISNNNSNSSSNREQFPLPQARQSYRSASHLPSHVTNSSLPTEILPDASQLLSSPSFSSDQFTVRTSSSRVAATMVQNESRKRESNGSVSLESRNKVQRGNLPHTRRTPDAANGALLPPQLHGRSNIVTEDMGTLFPRRRPAQSSQ